jgi:hypothetical protein
MTGMDVEVFAFFTERGIGHKEAPANECSAEQEYDYDAKDQFLPHRL